MSAFEILQKLRKKGELNKAWQQHTHNVPKEATKPTTSSSRPPAASERQIDPVVAKLKAARRAEEERKRQQAREKKGLQPKKESGNQVRTKKTEKVSRRPSTTPKPVQSKTQGVSSRTPEIKNQFPDSSSREKRRKMSFTELMAKASNIDQKKLSIVLKHKSPDAAPVNKKEPPSISRDALGQHKRNIEMGNKRQGLQTKSSGTAKNKSAQTKGTEERKPLPTRKPSSVLVEKLKKTQAPGQANHRQREEENESDDMSSFIASDEEEEEHSHIDYDREEIWSIFNPGKKRTHYEYDDYESDDMEATGADILQEELRSKKQAMEEDRREMEEEARLAALKRARKAGK